MPKQTSECLTGLISGAMDSLVNDALTNNESSKVLV